MNVSLLTILAIVYLVIAIVSIIYFILITFERPDILFQALARQGRINQVFGSNGRIGPGHTDSSGGDD